MRNKFLGDSLDMAKRALTHILSSDGFHVFIFPMPAAKEQFNFDLYQKLLNVNSHTHTEVMTQFSHVFRYPARKKYVRWMNDFARSLDSSNKSVVLLDPDKGIDSEKQTCEFISLNEVSQLAAANKACVIGVYHHKLAGKFRYERLVTSVRPKGAFAYNFGAAAICFVSHDSSRLKELKSLLTKELNHSKIIVGN